MESGGAPCLAPVVSTWPDMQLLKAGTVYRFPTHVAVENGPTEDVVLLAKWDGTMKGLAVWEERKSQKESKWRLANIFRWKKRAATQN
jgi:hypothetical protein